MPSGFSQAVPECARRLAAPGAPGHACRAARHPCKAGRSRRAARQTCLGHITERSSSAAACAELAETSEATPSDAALEIGADGRAEAHGAVDGDVNTKADSEKAADSSYAVVNDEIKACERVQGASATEAIQQTSLAAYFPPVARPALLTCVGSVLQAMIGESERTGKALPSDHAAACFCAKAAPKISIDFYLSRICTHIPLSDASFVLPLLYMERLACRYPGGVVNKLSWAKLLVTGVMLASKYLDDEEDIHYNNAFYAKVGGISVKEMSMLETRFLQLLDWDLYVTEAEYNRYSKFVRSAALGGA